MGQTPFLRILIPVICGILFCEFISPSVNLFFISIIGLLLILVSFFTPQQKHYALRWLFGVGFMLFIFSLTAQYYQYRAEKASCSFSQIPTSYIGEIIDLPLQKNQSIACEVNLTYPVDKRVMLYLEPDSRSKYLEPGDELLVKANMQPFKNLGNPNQFDYERFMRNKGFCGSAYVSANSWFKTGRRSSSIKTIALRVRAKMLNLYKDFNFDNDAYSFISAITLGYKADLTDDLKEAFRASGTSHVLAVSGLHVGIVYLIIISLFFFISKRGKLFFLKQLLVLLCLWGYVFITGLPVSVVRAAIMLSLIGIGSIFNKQGFTYNTLAVAAFFTLIINPFYLFDVGFQLSFAAVFSILFFQPKLSSLYTPNNKAVEYIWSLFTVSLAAQIGIFPLVLYYFGTFPTYFFITNLLVLPLIAIIIYSAVLLTLLSLLTFLNIGFLQFIYNGTIVFLELLIKSVLQIVYFFESLPMSVLEGYHISGLQLFLIFAVILSLTLYLLKRYTKQLIMFLMSLALLLVAHSLSFYNEPVNHFFVYNSYNNSDMGYIVDGKKIPLSANSNKTISHPYANIVLLAKNSYHSKVSNSILPVDILILASDNSFSVSELAVFFEPKKIIIDASIGRYAAMKMKNECEKLNINFHDISNSGAFLLNF